MALIKNAQDTYGDDLDYQNAYNKYNKEHNSKIKADAIKEADALSQQGDHLGAMNRITKAINLLDDEKSELDSKYQTYYQLYIDDVLLKSNNALDEGDYDSAESIIKSALKEVGNNEILSNKLEEIKSMKPISITTLNALNEDKWSWNEGTPIDPFNNDYSSSCNYAIISNTNKKYSHYIEYRLYGKYDYLQGCVAPYSSMEEDGDAYFQVYADDVLVYTSPTIVRKTDAFNYTVGIKDAEYIKIIVYPDWSSSIILSDVQVGTVTNNSTNETNSTNSKKKSITTLSPINQDLWSWNDGEPIDQFNTDYSHVCNYSILTNTNRKNSHYIEYRLNGDYNTLKGQIGSHTSMGEDGYGVVRIFADDVLIYTSPTISRLTDLFNFEVDVSNIDYLKFDVEMYWGSSIILSDVTLE